MHTASLFYTFKKIKNIATRQVSSLDMVFFLMYYNIDHKLNINYVFHHNEYFLNFESIHLLHMKWLVKFKKKTSSSILSTEGI